MFFFGKRLDRFHPSKILLGLPRVLTQFMPVLTRPVARSGIGDCAYGLSLGFHCPHVDGDVVTCFATAVVAETLVLNDTTASLAAYSILILSADVCVVRSLQLDVL